MPKKETQSEKRPTKVDPQLPTGLKGYTGVDPQLPPGLKGLAYYLAASTTAILLAILYYIFFCGCR